LTALWREALLARAVLGGKTHGYRHHSQLDRFRAHFAPRSAINAYLECVLEEARARGYAFDGRKVGPVRRREPLLATAGQLEFEWMHLLRKLRVRNPALFRQWRPRKPDAHPLFRIVPGPVEVWERRSPALTRTGPASAGSRAPGYARGRGSASPRRRGGVSSLGRDLQRRERRMTAFNVVRFRVKPGNEQAFIDAHRTMRPGLKGFIGGSLVRTGDRTFCMVGEWRNFKSIVDARPQMISMLDQVRGLLEDLGSTLGVTDPVSGESVLQLGMPKQAAAKRAAKPRKTAKKGARKAAGKRKAAKRGAKKTARKR
jgi:hypothetical protein